MNITFRMSSLLVLIAASVCCKADEPADCFAADVEAHVLAQYRIFGPQSRDREYFGFIYRYDGVIASAVSRGSVCQWTKACEVATRAAAALIPKGAKVLGEWHTHPHVTGSQNLSAEDVRGANDNRHVRCYRAFVSMSNGDIHSWNPSEASVLSAMESLRRLGNYRKFSG